MLTLSIENKSSGTDAYSRNEQVMLDGQSILIGKVSSNVYKFDEQNRLIESNWSTYDRGGNGGQDLFEYTADQLIITSTHLGMDNGVHPVPLNKQGLSSGDGIKYDAEGFLIEKVEGEYTTTYTIENGNIVREERKSTLPNSKVYVTLYEYDLTKPNLPNSHPYSGKVSKNLPVKVTNSDGVTTNSYSYSYLFDESKGLTRRYQKYSNGQYSVIDYSITCR
ncbi:hypothetical protein [Larkinella rosea]|uniref:DUF4595 domain-containing protein n=1 Tax=Larkinella rosea TaxID=2025312 RepID=A0A3P1BLR7_9BACT|nr:hypothetical protein [Larkinella rosea]RRB02040.1 hypothetical protein EHT25_16230 [Larkinella rosea]